MHNSDKTKFFVNNMLHGGKYGHVICNLLSQNCKTPQSNCRKMCEMLRSEISIEDFTFPFGEELSTPEDFTSPFGNMVSTPEDFTFPFGNMVSTPEDFTFPFGNMLSTPEDDIQTFCIEVIPSIASQTTH